jgi:ubiquinol-cytochrome c reductase cytochrome b subunit
VPKEGKPVASKALGWIVDRFGLRPIWDTLLDRQVPKDPWYHGDGMALLVLLSVLVVTGVFLSMGYCPAIDEAYLSIEHITHHQALGWFVRGLHYWSGGLMVVMLFLHVCRQILNGGYKSPREATWLVGVLLLFSVLTTSLLGYILRWDERGFYGLRVALAAFRSVPLIGEQLVLLVQGGPEITSLTLARVFSMHVILLPLLLLLLVSYHVYLVILHGTTTVGERKEPIETVEEQRELYQEQAEHPVKGEVFFPTAVIKISPWSLVALLLAVVLTLTVGPRELMPPANLTGESSASEEWWFAWYSALVALLPPAVVPTFQWLFPVALFLLLILLPFLDRSPHRGWRNRPVATTLVILLTLAILGLSWLRYQSPWTARPDAAEAPSVPEGVVLASEAEQGRLLFPKYGCTSCHAVAGSGRSQVGTDLARMNHLYSQSELRDYILHPPQGVAMPRYAGRLPEEDLARVVAFVLVAQTFRRTQE